MTGRASAMAIGTLRDSRTKRARRTKPRTVTRRPPPPPPPAEHAPPPRQRGDPGGSGGQLADEQVDRDVGLVPHGEAGPDEAGPDDEGDDQLLGPGEGEAEDVAADDLTEV